MHFLARGQRLTHQALVKLQGQCIGGGLVQRRRQVQCQALQAAADAELSAATSETQTGAVRRAAAGMGCQRADQAQLARLLQTFGADRALAAEQQRRF